jgi:hypothetical protein
MRIALLLSVAALAACAEAPPPRPLGERARTQCELAGLAPGQPQFADCVTRVMVAAVEAQNRPVQRAPVVVPQFQPIANPWAQMQQPRLQTTCTRWGNQTVCQ